MDANTQDDMKSQGTPCNGKVTPPDNEKPIENGDKKEKEGAQKKEEDKQKEEQKENKKKETPKIEQQIIGNAKNTKIGVINVYGAKQFNKNKNKKPVGNEIFVDPSKLLPRNPSSLSVFHSAVEINEKITRWEEERLMLLICQNQDISFSTAFQLIGNHRFETYDKRFLSFAGSNANRDDINLEMFLVHQIGRGEKLIVFIDIERRFSFFDSLFVGKMTAQSIKEQFQKKDILLICVADPQLMMQSKEQIEQKFFFVSWEIDFLPHLLRNYLPEKSSSIMEEILTQKAKGLWEEGNGNVFYDLIHRYMRENILEEEINKRKKLESNKIMTKVEKDDTFGGEIKEVKARDIFIDKEPHKTVLYTGVFFSKLTPIDFDRMVRLLLKNKTIEIEKSTQVITDDEKVKTVKTTEKKQVEELWDKEADKILKECSLQVVYADNNAQQMDFSYPYLRNDLKNLIEKEHPMYLKKQFEPIQYSGILFASNISTGITENIIRLAIHMISLNPDYYGGEWLKEFIYQVKEQYNFQYEPKDNPLEVIIQ
ncbi:MAG: hypothetical protein MUF15_22895, partial [Acidobacteria bacterium]|nr:hypothetical protein [Acidobacteriota bacterium]